MDEFRKKWLNVQRENNRWKWLYTIEEFAKKFGSAKTIIVEYDPIFDIPRYFETWNVKVEYYMFGIFPLSIVTFGKNLNWKEVENLKVPFAKIQYNYRHKRDKYNGPIPNRCL